MADGSSRERGGGVGAISSTRFAGTRPLTICWYVERRHPLHEFSGDSQPLAARRENAQGGALAEEVVREGGAGGEEMLAVVEDEQELPGTQELQQRLLRALTGFLGETERGSDSAGNAG